MRNASLSAALRRASLLCCACALAAVPLHPVAEPARVWRKPPAPPAPSVLSASSALSNPAGPSSAALRSEGARHRPPAAVIRPSCSADYRLQITSPENDSARISPAGRLRIRYRLRPKLCPGHRLHILTQGGASEIPNPSGELLLQNLNPGGHRLQLQVVGEDGAPLARSPLHRVYLL